MINRDDMLELTRRMTLKRNCFIRVAGGYYDEDGVFDTSFNVNFLKLSAPEQNRLLTVAKSIPFAKTNEELIEHKFSENEKQSLVWKSLMELNRCELKNDALLENLYEMLGSRLAFDGPCGVYFFQGVYDILRKGTDKAGQWESEEVYHFLICAVCPVNEDYVPGEALEGFLFPSFVDRSSNENRINLMDKSGESQDGLLYLFWD